MTNNGKNSMFLETKWLLLFMIGMSLMSSIPGGIYFCFSPFLYCFMGLGFEYVHQKLDKGKIVGRMRLSDNTPINF